MGMLLLFVIVTPMIAGLYYLFYLLDRPSKDLRQTHRLPRRAQDELDEIVTSSIRQQIFNQKFNVYKSYQNYKDRD